MQKKTKISRTILALVVVVIIGLSIYICFTTGWLWVWQMLICCMVMIIIIAIKSRSGDSAFTTYMAEFATLLGVNFSPTLLETIPQIGDLHNFLSNHFPLYGDNISLNLLKGILYFVSVSVIWGIFTIVKSLFFRDKTVMQKTPASKFDVEFLKRRKNFCDMLKIELSAIDKGAQWNDYYFTPLEAEFIIEDNLKIRRKSRDIITAIRERSKEKVFLVLGDPGSGKSTVLRKLAKDLISEVETTNRIPIYINLKDWNPQRRWTQNDLPNEKDLFDFIRSNLDSQLGDLFAHKFLEMYLDKLCLNGQLFFIFDSFDEIPFLLDETENSWLVEAISNLLYKVLAGQSGSRGILASRFFRKPTQAFQTRVTLEIKPFDNNRIRHCLNKYRNGETLSKIIYKEYRGWIDIIKNPFYANLLSVYFDDNNKIPQREIELYDHFFHSRINQVEEAFQLLTENNVETDRIIIYAQSIAEEIFNNKQYGIGIPINNVLNYLHIPQYIIEILEKAKLIRIGGNSKKIISFSHRRFNEYLVATQLINRNILSYLDTIPEDSKWHDTLVLYAQLCPDSQAEILINYCCDYLKDMVSNVNDKKDNPVKYEINFRKSLHSLRFLTAAFTYDKNRLIEYEEYIFNFVSYMQNDEYLLYHKFAVNAITILSEDHIKMVLNKALNENISWIRDEAIEGCLYLTVLSKSIINQLIFYYIKSDVLLFLSNFRNNWFIVSLFQQYKIIKYFIVFQTIEYLIKIIIFCFIFINFIINIKIIYSTIYLIFFILMYIFNIFKYFHDFIDFITGFNINITSKFDEKILRFTEQILKFQDKLLKSKKNTIKPEKSEKSEKSEKTYVNIITNIILNFEYFIIPIFVLMFFDIENIEYYYNINFLFLPYTLILLLFKNIELKNFIDIIKNLKKEFIKKILFILIGIIFGMGLVTLLIYLTMKITLLSLSLISMVMLRYIIISLYHYIVSYRFYKTVSFKNKAYIDRKELLTIFENIKVTFLQKKILTDLSNKKIKLIGEWGIKPPSLNNNNLDVMLAILDGKSLDLL